MTIRRLDHMQHHGMGQYSKPTVPQQAHKDPTQGRPAVKSL